MTRLVQLFPLWVVLGGALGLLYPPSLEWFIEYELVTPGLQLIMLGMGLTLELADFSRVLQRPGPIFWGVLLQYGLMPAIGWAAGYLFQLPGPFAVGLVLVCCCPGGTASNVIAYLARADVALSVSMTACSTLLAVLLTPLLVEWLAGSRVHVDVLGLLGSTAQVVLIPVALGLSMRRFAPGLSRKVLPYAPAAAVLSIVLICGGILAVRSEAIIANGLRVLGAVVAAHLAGFGAGYLLGGLRAGFGSAARTISIEVGMQNSGLGAVLAQAHFANPLTAVPSAISAVVHSVLGSALAAYWSRRPAVDVSSLTDPGAEPLM